MNNTRKIIACLYTCIVAAGATTITFNGTQNQNGIINFDVMEQNGTVTITKTKINEKLLQEGNRDVTLVIPGRVNDKQVCIGEQAFKNLYLYGLQLKLKFKTTEDKITERRNPRYRDKRTMIRISRVQLPSNCYMMFCDSKIITEIDLSGVNSSNVTNMDSMFAFCNNLQKINFGNFDTSNVTTMDNMFTSCSSLTALDLKCFNTGKVKYMSHMFSFCENLKELDLSHFDTKNVNSMSYMFDNCSSLTALDLKCFNTGKVFSMLGMFDSCQNLKKLDLSNFNTEEVGCMSKMFNGCFNLTVLNLSNFNTEKVEDMSNMFDHCKSLRSLDLGSFDMRKVSFVVYMFADCENLENLTLGKGLSLGHQKAFHSVFANCKRLRDIQGLSIDNVVSNEVLKNAGVFDNCPAGKNFIRN